MLFPAPVHYPSNGFVTGGQVGHADLVAPCPGTGFHIYYSYTGHRWERSHLMTSRSRHNDESLTASQWPTCGTWLLIVPPLQMGLLSSIKLKWLSWMLSLLYSFPWVSWKAFHYLSWSKSSFKLCLSFFKVGLWTALKHTVSILLWVPVS